jgi:hypothetical protein
MGCRAVGKEENESTAVVVGVILAVVQVNEDEDDKVDEERKEEEEEEEVEEEEEDEDEEDEEDEEEEEEEEEGKKEALVSGASAISSGVGDAARNIGDDAAVEFEPTDDELRRVRLAGREKKSGCGGPASPAFPAPPGSTAHASSTPADGVSA